MAETINDLYLKYTNKVGTALEKDRYFQYLFEIVRAGTNVIEQKSQILHKIVDERWLTTIEDSLDSINKIIEKPRRFVATREEVVPVELAKRITADSVRHLSMHTQYIASAPDSDTVYPTKIMTVSTEDSYDLYENRFIYHLIQRLVTFIDKRTDVIFWSTGDETKNTVSIDSKIDDGYEQIEYKLKMSVKNNESFAENDSDNMQVFMRIDRVRRLVMALRDSAFCSIMAGCSKVRSPIQRTNLLMKDPDYRTCYKLWQFLESYDEVGYTIEVEDSVLQFDEEYLLQMYTNIITNYTVFKSLLEGDPRKMEEIKNKHRKPIKPKFVKKIVEEIVDSRDIEDVEIRQVFIEEVTQAQLDAEAKLEEQTARVKELESAVEEMDDEMEATLQQVQMLSMTSAEAEQRADEAEEQRAALETENTELKDSLAETQETNKRIGEELEELKAASDETKSILAEAQEKIKALEAERDEFKNGMESAVKRAEEADKARFDAIEKMNAASSAMEEARTEAEKSRAEMEDAQKRALKAEKERKTAQEEAREAKEARSAAEENAENAEKARLTAEKKAKEETLAREAAEKDKTDALDKAKDAESKKNEALSQVKEAQTALREAEKERRDAIIKAENSEKEKNKAEEKAEIAEKERAEAEEISKNAVEEANQAKSERIHAIEDMERAVSDANASREALEAAEKERDKALKKAERSRFFRSLIGKKEDDEDDEI